MSSDFCKKNFRGDFIIPELITGLLILSIKFNSFNYILEILLFLLLSFSLRLIFNSASIIHGLGHVLITVIVDKNINFINFTNILENRSVDDIFKSLIPFNPLFERGVCPWLTAGNTDNSRIRAKALGGIVFNLIAVVIALLFLSTKFNLLVKIFIVANLLLAFTSLSDIAAFVTGIADYFNCGNFGLVGKRNPKDRNELLPKRFVEIYQKMGRETEVRGEQAGGGLVFARDRNKQIVLVGKKIVNIKRDNLTKSLEAAFAWIRKKAVLAGIKPLESTIMGAWHYRYGTSSAPSILETHWHEWTSARSASVWQVKNGEWVRTTKNVNHRITHNGDFDAWMIFGQAIANAKLGLWLERVLHTPNATHGDSPKIAGMMDLLITKGMWDASVRLAYQLTIASAIEDAFAGTEPSPDAPNTVPSEEELNSWTNIFDRVFEFYATLLSHQDQLLCKKYLHRFEEDILWKISQNSASAQWSPQKQTAFVKTAIHAFFDNDPYQATKIFMSKAEGSFGLVVASTLDEQRLVVSSKGQPISIGCNRPQEYLVYASEPAAVNAVLFGFSESWRLDLDQKNGEIASISYKDVTVYSMSAGRELLKSELQPRQIPMAGNPYIKPHKTETEDPVEGDIQEIPQIMREIEVSWRNSRSFNCQSADYLANLLMEKAQRFQQKRQKAMQAGITTEIGHSKAVDLLVTGVESSLWIGERFAEDLKTIFPCLHVKTISANELLKILQHDFSRLELGKRSIVLAISQSGQTFSTLQATNACEQLHQKGMIGEVFIMTEELNSLMGGAIGQNYGNGTAFCRRIFTTNSGRRTAEPCTLSTAALQQTLTELLLYLAKRMLRRYPDYNPLGMMLSPESILELELIKDDFIYQNVVTITGSTACKGIVKSPEHEKLVRVGRQWAMHVTETPIVWGIHALYVLITVGWAIPFGQTIPLANTLFNLIVWVTGLQGDSFLLTFITPVMTLADIAIYVFGPWLWALALRCFQGRQLLARTGKRTVVIGDLPWVHQLLKSYISKLFSLSYGIACVEVHGDNPQDQMLHCFGHRIVRGTLIFLGVPDGRRGQMQKQEENATIMTGKQANGIRNFGAGPEIVAVGHNPKLQRQGFDETMILWSDINSLHQKSNMPIEEKEIVEKLRESRFSSFERLLAGYVFFWALAKKVASFPCLQYQHWKSQSRTKIMTTASPVSAVNLDSLQIEKTILMEQKDSRYSDKGA
ncbi:hypothetical protein [Scytonema sp. NUACC26]|uniref:hypothetical protein n=1 Tax=Scytonema sp. NUACC26 TaxID=3140176 RepID=UPI0034DC7810